MYALYLHFLGLSFRKTSKALEPFEQKKEDRGEHIDCTVAIIRLEVQLCVNV
jgi:hypothetical protein